MAMLCDLIFAAKIAMFNAHYVLIGESPDAGMSYILPRQVGEKMAAWLMFTGERVSAQEGYEMGFVNQVVEDSDLMNEANGLAKRLTASATLAIASTKKLINRSWYVSLENQMEYEKKKCGRIGLTEDFKEAFNAFKEKRRPMLKGR